MAPGVPDDALALLEAELLDALQPYEADLLRAQQFLALLHILPETTAA